MEMPGNFGLFSENLILDADGSYGNTYTFTAQALDGTAADVQLFPTFIDVM
jgi:hypothetical protein